MSKFDDRVKRLQEFGKNARPSFVEKLDDVTKIKHGCLDITYKRYPTPDAEIEIFYKEKILLARKPNLTEALEYAYVGVTLSNPLLGDWCYGYEKDDVLSHITDMLKMLGVEVPRPNVDTRLITGIHRSIQLRTEEGYLHPKEEDIRVTVHRCIPANWGALVTTISLSNWNVTISQKFNEYGHDGLINLDELARKLYAKHFE